MKKTLSILCGTAALLSFAACSTTPAPKSLPPGQYEKTVKTTNMQGTTTEKKTNTDVYYENGQKKAVQKTETSKDPKGWFNKSKSTTTRTYN